MIEAIFFDRDGTLGDGTFEYPTDFTPFENIKQVFLRIKEKGIKVYIFTNQSCVARGKANGYDFNKEFSNYGADDWFICPHDDVDNCDCRKPKSGLLLEAKKKYNLNLSNCIVVGDRDTDLIAGVNVGTKCVLVLTGKGIKNSEIVKNNENISKNLMGIIPSFHQILDLIKR